MVRQRGVSFQTSLKSEIYPRGILFIELNSIEIKNSGSYIFYKIVYP